LEVAPTPATKHARAAFMPASVPCSRRSPNSTTLRPAAAATTRVAFDAIIVWKLIWLSTNVSMSCACGSGATTCRRALGDRVDVALESQRRQLVEKAPGKRIQRGQVVEPAFVEPQRLQVMQNVIEAAGHQEVAAGR
jgi:hypothetical protein